MDRCRLLVEGQTEETFANRTLIPHLWAAGFHDVSVTVLTTKRVASGGKHRGGLTAWRQLRRDLGLLLHDEGAVVTTLVDFYALPADVPGISTMLGATARARAEHVEGAIAAEIDRPNFVAHVTLHEFEAMLYVDPAAVARRFGDDAVASALAADLDECGEPELVDDGPTTAPSKRIQRHLPTYLKTTDGPTVLDEIGLEAIRRACPHFDDWLTKIESCAPG